MARATNLDGDVVIVDGLGRLYTLATALSADISLNSRGLVLSLVFDGQQATNPDDYIGYLSNVGPLELSLGHISFMATAPTTLWLDYVVGEPVFTSAADIEQTNRKLGDPTDPFMTASHDTSITGLTNEGSVFFERCAVANERYFLDTVSGFNFPFGTAIGLRSSNPAALVTMNSSLGIVVV